MNLLKKGEFKKNKKKLNIVLFSIPFLLSAIYFYSIGRKRYIVQSDIIVRKATNNSQSSFNISNIIGAGNQSSIEDSLFLQTYLESPQVLKSFDEKFKIEEVFKKKGLDLYAGISRDATFEEKYELFKKQISINLNERSGILRIKSLGLDPENAYQFNLFLIDESENFINKLNQSIFLEQLEFLNEQVEKNSKRLEQANKELSNFQKSNKSLDAISEAQMTTTFISELESQIVKLKVELAAIQRQFVDQNSPEIILLKDQISELKNQINIERDLLVNPKGKNFNEKIITLSILKMNQKFANDLYITSLQAAEKASVDSIQQQRFLAIISEPQFPEEEWMNWRHRGFLTLISIFLITFSLVRFTLGMADNHKN